MKGAFDFKTANFSGIVELEPNITLAISKFVHQANIEINEDGSEAVAASGVFFGVGSSPGISAPIKVFKCNRPFIFIFHEKKFRNILFIGKYIQALVQ